MSNKMRGGGLTAAYLNRRCCPRCGDPEAYIKDTTEGWGRTRFYTIVCRSCYLHDEKKSRGYFTYAGCMKYWNTLLEWDISETGYTKTIDAFEDSDEDE